MTPGKITAGVVCITVAALLMLLVVVTSRNKPGSPASIERKSQPTEAAATSDRQAIEEWLNHYHKQVAITKIEGGKGGHYVVTFLSTSSNGQRTEHGCAFTMKGGRVLTCENYW